ncbi:C4-dicarboxylate ABC transporter [Vibrio sp. CAIM 722]|uniref:C4-dicarboxylate ABC transporter n=1 Tax=Vibrio eleionomae TaxID=2653505 RepID=A0A7X4LLH1_9VIBR|nr:TRAP transporter substrate-binding protein DctP [Vibrio eleionomae]MZI94099.1 C4-dicarboxylate ABC transporter [Vibrio eleionomae]
MTYKIKATKSLLNLFAITSISAMTALSFSTQAETLKIGHVRPQDSVVDNDIKALNKELTTLSGNDLKLKIYAANALGDYTIVQERVSVGAVDMSLQPASTSTNRKLQLSALPYLANNWEQAKKVYGPNSYLRQAMSKIFKQQDIKVLAVYPVYFGGISLNRTPIEPGNPDASKGIKLRVPPSKSFQLLADSLGYIGSPLPFSEAFTAVQTGVVDGVIGSGAEGYYSSFRDVTKTYIPLNTHFEVWYLMINAETFDDLDNKDKKALETAALHFEQNRWKMAKADQAKNEARLQKAGAEIIKVTPEQLAKTAEKVRKVVWPEIMKDMGEDWSKPLLEKIEKQAQ